MLRVGFTGTPTSLLQRQQCCTERRGCDVDHEIWVRFQGFGSNDVALWPLQALLMVPVVPILLGSLPSPWSSSAASTQSLSRAAPKHHGGLTPVCSHRLLLRDAQVERRLDACDSSRRALPCVRYRHSVPDGSGTDQVTGVCPYCNTVANDFPSTAAWSTSTVAQLRSWGFNSLGPFSDHADLGAQMPYEVQLTMASGDDWFTPSFVTHADQVAQTQVAPLADDPNVIGYFTDTELDWGPYLGSGSDFFSTALHEYLQLPAGSPGLAVAEQYAGNPSGFVTALATRYFSVTTAAIRMYDSNHLILGVKAEAQEIQPESDQGGSTLRQCFQH